MLPNNIEVLHELSIIDSNSKKHISEFAIVKYIESLEQELGLLKIALDQKSVLLNSCEAALEREQFPPK